MTSAPPAAERKESGFPIDLIDVLFTLQIVQDCDDEARRMEKCEEMLILSQQIEFPKDIRRIPIITGSRFLVKSGQVTQLVNRDENKLTFGKKFSKVTLTLFLFTDLLILAKKKK